MLIANMKLCAAAALATAFLSPAADAPHFVCKDGVTVQRTLEMKGTRELTKYSMRVGDASQDRDDIHRSMKSSWKQVTHDEIRGCSDGRVTALARTYKTLEKNRSETIKAPDGEKTLDLPETSDLLDKTVVFKRGEDKKSWKRTIDDADDELTADLEADMDYRALLPEKNAEPGAKWEVDMADAKLALLRPGGDIPFHGKDEIKSLDKRLRKLAWDATEGKLALKLGKARDDGGHKVVDIDFEGDVSYSATTAPEGDEKGPRSVRIEDAQKLEGKLVWNLDAGRAQSIEWKSKGTVSLTVGGTGKQQDGSEVDVDQIQTFDEEYAYTGTFEVQ